VEESRASAPSSAGRETDPPGSPDLKESAYSYAASPGVRYAKSKTFAPNADVPVREVAAKPLLTIEAATKNLTCRSEEQLKLAGWNE
jgi:hypothetical protein